MKSTTLSIFIASLSILLLTASCGKQGLVSKKQSVTRNNSFPSNDSSPLPLTQFTASPGSANSTIDLNLSFPQDITNYSRIVVARKAGSVPPNTNCDNGDLVVTMAYPQFFSKYTDTQVIAGQYYSYRACIFSPSGASVSDNVAIDAIVHGTPVTQDTQDSQDTQDNQDSQDNQDTEAPPALQAFNATAGPNNIRTTFHLVYGPTLQDYYQLQIRKVAGAIAPSASCDNGSVIYQTLAPFVSEDITIRINGGIEQPNSYRLCIYDASGNVTSDNTAINILPEDNNPESRDNPEDNPEDNPVDDSVEPEPESEPLPKPVMSIKANNQSGTVAQDFDGSVRIEWSAIHLASCVLRKESQSGNEDISTHMIGTVELTNQKEDSTLKLLCVDSADGEWSASITIDVADDPCPNRVMVDETHLKKFEDISKSYYRRGFRGTVFISQCDKILFWESYGSYHKKTNRWRIASLSKQFTAAAIMILEQQGKLSTSDAVGKYLRGWGSRTTLHHLLTHTRSGRWSYSNYGFRTLANVVAKVSRMRFSSFLKKYIYEPAGMKDTYGGCGEGCVVSSALDLHTWHKTLYTNDVLSEASREKMFTPHAKSTSGYIPDQGKSYYGYGWFIDDVDEHRIIHHGGDYSGNHTRYYRYVDHDVVIAIYSRPRQISSSFNSNLARVLFDWYPEK